MSANIPDWDQLCATKRPPEARIYNNKESEPPHSGKALAVRQRKKQQPTYPGRVGPPPPLKLLIHVFRHGFDFNPITHTRAY